MILEFILPTNMCYYNKDMRHHYITFTTTGSKMEIDEIKEC